ncbi:MAG: tRNA (5-methylaminomethyl-2-thiouridine)(34)-methyltransferase MnmD [Hyphomonadaceae bacterium]|nr:tRNA (5-methylaminomethyl-2-thiouridine)(34)-methyltransferase MnmD [Hyphomonadaceae bacterium]
MILAPPVLHWAEDGAPIDAESGDVFFSRNGGLAETEAVFLAGCGLPQRWRDRPRFAIGELGFGSGLNALAVWRAWRSARPPGGVLHFLSFERRPWRVEDAARAHALFPDVAALSARLCARWPVGVAGPQRLWFDEEGFCLTLLLGEAEAMAAGLRARIDAWFLDGFAPAKNPQLWTPGLLRQVRRLSAPDARLATYSVARAVRDNLEAAGFAWRKAPGFGAKRERLEAWPVHAEAAAVPGLAPWGPTPDGPIVVFGAGASGNPAALIAPRLDLDEGPTARFHRAAYLAALDFYSTCPAFNPCGVRQRCPPQRAARFAAAPPLPPALLEIGPDWLHHPRAGVAEPRALLELLLAGATVRFGTPAASLASAGAGWRILDAAGGVLAEAAAVVLAAGPMLEPLTGWDWLPLQGSRGQIEHAPELALTRMEATTDGAYAAPWAGGLVFGATFDPVPLSAAVKPDELSRASNLAAASRLLPEAAAALHGADLRSRAAVRVAAPDRLPIVGLAPDAPAWNRQYAGLAQGRSPATLQPPPALAGLYLLAALGARGFTTGPILAERLAAEVCGEPQALDHTILEALHPARFLERRLRRSRS